MSRSRRAVSPAGILSLAPLGLSLAPLWLSLAAVGLWPATAWAQMYRWTDEQGGIHYSQGIYSVPERFRSKAQLLAFPSSPAAPPATPAPAGGGGGQGAGVSFPP